MKLIYFGKTRIAARKLKIQPQHRGAPKLSVSTANGRLSGGWRLAVGKASSLARFARQTRGKPSALAARKSRKVSLKLCGLLARWLARSLAGETRLGAFATRKQASSREGIMLIRADGRRCRAPANIAPLKLICFPATRKPSNAPQSRTSVRDREAPGVAPSSLQPARVSLDAVAGA